MMDFTITEDFTKNEIEFDKRFSDVRACYNCLFKQKCSNGFICKKCRLKFEILDGIPIMLLDEAEDY